MKAEERVHVVAPTFQMISTWACEHGVPRRAIKPLCFPEHVQGLPLGTEVFFWWPPTFADPKNMLGLVRSRIAAGMLTEGDCKTLEGRWHAASGTSSGSAPS